MSNFEVNNSRANQRFVVDTDRYKHDFTVDAADVRAVIRAIETDLGTREEEGFDSFQVTITNADKSGRSDAPSEFRVQIYAIRVGRRR